jgi:transcription initiation factor IIE alpha subunit
MPPLPKNDMAESSKPQHLEIERAIIFFVLERDEASRDELVESLGNEPEHISEALDRLRDEGVIVFVGEDARPTDCCRYIDRLNLIDIPANT